MKWLVTSVFIVIIVAKIATSQQMKDRPPARGSCASINYASQCCPPASKWSACMATDGSPPCRCDTICYLYKECCNDHNCTEGILIANGRLMCMYE